MCGKTLRVLRRRNGQTQGELAELAGISVSYLSLIECDKREISFSLFVRLCKSLVVSPVVVALMFEFAVQEEAEAVNLAMKKFSVENYKYGWDKD